MITIRIEDVGEDQCVGRVYSTRSITPIFETLPQVCQPDAIKLIGRLFQTLSVDVLYADERGTPMNNHHPKVKQCRG